MSYSNIRMYYEVLPTYNPKDKKDKKSTENIGFSGLLSMLKSKDNGG